MKKKNIVSAAAAVGLALGAVALGSTSASAVTWSPVGDAQGALPYCSVELPATVSYGTENGQLCNNKPFFDAQAEHALLP